MFIARKAVVMAIAPLAALSGAALATPLPPGSDAVTPTDFAVIQATQGTLLNSTTFTGAAGTFAATMRSAVYQNTVGGLDFYYQVSRLGPGTSGRDDLIKTLTASIFDGFTVDAYRAIFDPDGAGQFLPSSTTVTPLTTIGRTPNGNVITVSFALPGQAGVGGTDTTSTYIFRTNATAYGPGFWSIQDGTSISGDAFAPVLAVPEIGTWAMLLSGFGLIGGTLRRPRRKVALG